MNEEICIEMKWATAVSILLETYRNSPIPQSRAEAKDELLRCADIADNAAAQQHELHSLRAHIEGWTIADAEDSEANQGGAWPIQIQCLDPCGRPENDKAVHKLVVEGAKAGLAHCLYALKRLRREAKPELATVYGVPFEPYSVTDVQLDGFELMTFGRILTREAL